MDDTEDNARYPPKAYSLHRSVKFPLHPHQQPHRPVPAQYNNDYEDEDEEEKEGEDEEELFGERNDEEFDIDDDSYHNPRGYPRNLDEDDGSERYPKRQKVTNSSDWSEGEKFVLLEVWGDKFLQSGRNSLRSEEWADVAEKVSETLKMKRSEGQCRQMMDVLKRKYKKEKAKRFNNGSNWAYFKKMDMLMMQDFSGGGGGLACGLDSGEYVFMDTRVYLDHANGNDEMRDSPCESEDEEANGKREGSGGNEGMKWLRVLADSVQKFGEIYEKIESSKREQMMELERMKEEFQRELELQKKQILERAQAEIAKMREEDDDDEEDEDGDDDSNSGENASE